MTLVEILRKLDREHWCYASAEEIRADGRRVIGSRRDLSDAIAIEGGLDYERRLHGRRSPWYDVELIKSVPGEGIVYEVFPLRPAAGRPTYRVCFIPFLERQPQSVYLSRENYQKPWWLWKNPR